MPNENNENWLSMKLEEVEEGEWYRVCSCVCVRATGSWTKTVAYFAAVNEKYVSAAKQKPNSNDYDIMWHRSGESFPFPFPSSLPSLTYKQHLN